MRKLTRRVVLWGGAIVIAAAGFAFMASNAIDGTSLGVGTGRATGYTVTTIAWHSAQVTSLTNHTFWVTGVTVVLTSKATTAPANSIPSSINVALVLSTGAHLVVSTGPHGSCQFGTTGHAWTLNGSGQGTGKLSCTVSVQASGEPPATHVTGIAVEAST